MSHAPLSPAALVARRQNARHSTGPRSEAGKNRSRWNALQHGGFATGLAWSDAALRALGEDPEQFRQLVEGLKSAEGPADDPLWELQLEDLARLYWRRRRLERAWEEWARRQGRDAVLTPTDSQGALLLKQLDTVDRSIDRKTRLLLRMREAEDRRNRQLERTARAPAKQDLYAWDNSSEEDVLSEEELAQKEAEIIRLERETAPRERETTRILARLGQLENNLENAERSEEVEENKRAGMKNSDEGQVTSDEHGGK